MQNPYTGILSVFSTRLLNGNDIHIYEDGDESRDFLYIDDAVNATIMALENKKADNKIFNVGSGSNISVNEVARRLHDLYKAKGRLIVNGRFRLGDIRHNYADLTRITAILGFSPKVNFNDGVISFVNWVKTQNIEEDKYDASINELKNKGLIR